MLSKISKNKYDFKNFIYIFIIIFLTISFFIGERSNFAKVFIMILLFTFLFEKKFYKFKFALFTIFFIVIALVINFNDKYQKRFVNQCLGLWRRRHMAFCRASLSSPIPFPFFFFRPSCQKLLDHHGFVSATVQFDCSMTVQKNVSMTVWKIFP